MCLKYTARNALQSLIQAPHWFPLVTFVNVKCSNKPEIISRYYDGTAVGTIVPRNKGESPTRTESETERN